MHIGVQNPITLFEGMVLDGWNRYRAAIEVDCDCPSVEMAEWIDPRQFVMAQNLARRHITQAQLAMATTAVYEWKPIGTNQHGASTLNVQAPKSTTELAEIAGVHKNTITQAKAVQTSAVADVVDAVKRGDMGLPKAAAIAQLPQAEQAAAMDKPLSQIKPKKPAPAPLEVEPEAEAPPDYSELDAAHDQISELQAELVVARMGDIPEEQKQQAAELIAEKDAHIKTIEATLKAVTLSRDSLLEERAQMLRQLKAQRAEIERLKANK